MSENIQNQEQDLNEILKIRRGKFDDLKEAGNDPFKKVKYDVECYSQDIKENYDEYEGKEVSIAGRIMSKRIMGKASFCNVQDKLGNIQLYVGRDIIGTDEYTAFKKMDIGDIIGLKGEVFKTKTEEISIKVHEMEFLSKQLRTLHE